MGLCVMKIITIQQKLQHHRQQKYNIKRDDGWIEGPVAGWSVGCGRSSAGGECRWVVSDSPKWSHSHWNDDILYFHGIHTDLPPTFAFTQHFHVGWEALKRPCICVPPAVTVPSPSASEWMYIPSVPDSQPANEKKVNHNKVNFHMNFVYLCSNLQFSYSFIIQRSLFIIFFHSRMACGRPSGEDTGLWVAKRTERRWMMAQSRK